MMYDLERRKYLPKWFNLYNNPSSGSLLYRFLTYSWLTQYAELFRDIQDYSGTTFYNGYSEPRLAWMVSTHKTSPTKLTISFICPAGSGIALQTTDKFTFLHATTPVFIYIDNKVIFRNLEVIEITTTPASDYSINVGHIVHDTDIWYKNGVEFERFQASPDIFNGVITLPIITESILRYSSSVMASSLDNYGKVKLNEDNYINLVPIDLPNSWDSIGGLLRRLPREDNYSYAQRIKSASYLVGGTSYQKLEATISRELDLINTINWGASSILDFQSLNINNIVDIKIYNVNKNNTLVENLKKISNNTYRTTKIPDSNSLYISIGGLLTTPASTIDNTVYFYTDPQTTPQARYNYTTYSINRNSSGFITTIVPSSGNLDTTISYPVYYSSAIKVNTLNSTQYLSNLYNPDKTPSQFFINLSKEIQQRIKTNLGYTTWDRINWYTDTVIRPQVTYLPRILDQNL